MEEIKNAAFAMEQITMKVAMVESLAYLLWDSMADGRNELDERIYGNTALLLYEQVKETNAELQKAVKSIFAGLGEARA